MTHFQGLLVILLLVYIALSAGYAVSILQDVRDQNIIMKVEPFEPLPKVVE